MASPRREPYAAQAQKVKNQMRDTFQTTYTNSYKNLPTDKVSPLITNYYDMYRSIDPADDNSPYPCARDTVQPIYRKPYRVEQRPGTDKEHFMEDFSRTRFEDSTLRRDIYREPLPPRNYIQHEQDPPMADPRDQYQEYRREHGQMNGQMNGQGERYQDQLIEGEQDKTDLKPIFCNKCFKSNACMNRLACGHQYCDECMANIPVQDSPFRDKIVWHYSCEICNKLTSDPKLVRLDPYGRRLPHRPSSR